MGITPEVRDKLPILDLPAQKLGVETVEEYNERCTELIRDVLRNLAPGDMIRTHYPGETAESEDTVKLNAEGEIEVVDWGTS